MWKRFGLKALFVLTALAGVASWRVAIVWREYENERRIHAHLRERGLYVTTEGKPPCWLPVGRDWEIWQRSKYIHTLRPRAPVDEQKVKITNDDLAEIGRLENLQALDILRWDITDNGMAAIENPNLIAFIATDMNLTDAGLKHLARCPIERLRLHGVRFDGSCLWDFQQEPLIQLVAEGSRLDDAGMEAIGRFENLQELTVWSSRITDRGLLNLLKLEKLNDLVVAGPRITDDGILQLTKIRSLRHLWFSGRNLSADLGTKVNAIRPDLCEPGVRVFH